MKPAPQPASPPQQLYNEARQAQSNGNHTLAIDRLNKLSTDFPLSPYAQLATVERAYAHYRLQQADLAVKDARQFLYDNPKHKSADYAHYLIGLARSGQAMEDSTSAEQSHHSREAFSAFAQLVKQYPDSKYRDDANQRLGLLRNQMARQELAQVKASLDNDQHSEAVKRAKYINEHYPGTAAAQEALEMVTRAATVTISPQRRIGFLQISAPNDPESSARESWFLQQNSSHYAIQIAAERQRQALETIAREHQLENRAFVYRRQQDQQDWYTLLYGSYKNWTEAIEAAELIKAQLGLKNVDIRQYKELHNAVSKQD